MKFFIDSAELSDIKKARDLGILDGVTTNPTLVAKTGKSYESVIKEICEICKGPVSAEVLSQDYEGMLSEARQWAKFSENIVVKIPLTEAGIQTTAACSKDGIKTNVTLCFQPLQALLAAKAGATYISPFVGRLDDIGQNGMDCIKQIKEIYQHYHLKTQILVASIRSTMHLQQAALLGADVATIPYKVLGTALKHPLTDLGLDTFNSDAVKIPRS